MDIIASHRMGLIEQIESDALALAGRPGEAVQRAIVAHHMSDMLGHAHVFALLAGRASLALDAALARLERAAGRWRWGTRRAEREALVERAASFGMALRALDAERCAALLVAHRLAASPGLGEAAARLGPALLGALHAVQAARGRASARERLALFNAWCDWADARFAERLATALGELAWPARGTAPARVVAGWTISAAGLARAGRGGAARIERELRRSQAMPADFAANPAQAFFRLQRRVDERRRGDFGDHLSPDEAVRLVA